MGKFVNQPDLLLTGVPRSGTTLVNSLFHYPPKQWMFYEQFTDLDVTEVDSFLSTERWGAKQINKAAVLWFLSKYKPKKIMVIVRNLRDAGMSYAARAAYHYRNETNVRAEKEIRNRVKMVGQMAEYLIDAKENGGILTKEGRYPVDIWVRYEDFVSNPEQEKRRIEEVTGWGMEGSPTFYFDNIRHTLSREAEKRFHGGRITTKTLNRYKEVPVHPFVLKMVDRLSRYTELFYPEI